MPKISNPRDVKYLAFEGGGGKGVAYLGAVRALEQLGVLPIDPAKQGTNQIKGISGASAGAITAMFLALGADAKQLEQILANKQTFLGFFDGPDVGFYRIVNAKNEADMGTDAPSKGGVAKYIRDQAKQISKGRQIAKMATNLAKLAGKIPNDPILKQLARAPEAYVYNLLIDRGFFPGFAARTFLEGSVRSFLEPQVRQLMGSTIAMVPSSFFSFKKFYELTGVDLMITGANTSKHQPAMFSRRHTPYFPVAEAVGISMNLPFLFKPVRVDAKVPVNKLNASSDAYKGRWIDGGLLNNLPIHAFDYLSPQISKKYPDLRPLNPAILAIRLTDGPLEKRIKPQGWNILLQYLGDFIGTVLHPSEGGQIRFREEAYQTVDLLTYDLTTTNFGPTEELKKKPVAEAKKAVLRYFDE